MRNVAIVLGLGLAAMTAAAAQPRVGADARQQELNEVEEKLKDRTREEARLKDEAKQREREIETLRRQLIESANSVQDAERKIAAILEELGALEAEEQRLNDQLNDQRQYLGDVLAALQSLERSRPPALLVSPDDAVQAARTAMLLADAAPALDARAKELRLALTSLAAVRERLVAERTNLERTNIDVLARRTLLADLIRRKQSERDVAQRLAASAQRETAALAARASSLRDLVERLKRLARTSAPRLKPPKPRDLAAAPTEIVSAPPTSPAAPYKPAKAFAASQGALRAPVVGRLVGRFGEPRPEGGGFQGVRFGAADRAIVTAPYEGSIKFARAWGLLGNLIVLDVGDGFHILLYGVGSFLVEEGQTVAAGEPIGAMSGQAPMLDLEIHKDGQPVNPSLWLSRKTAGDPGA